MKGILDEAVGFGRIKAAIWGGKSAPTRKEDKKKNPNYRSNKRMNKREFNIMAKKRRRKAKFDARGRKINQRVARRKRK